MFVIFKNVIFWVVDGPESVYSNKRFYKCFLSKSIIYEEINRKEVNDVDNPVFSTDADVNIYRKGIDDLFFNHDPLDGKDLLQGIVVFDVINDINGKDHVAVKDLFDLPDNHDRIVSV